MITLPFDQTAAVIGGTLYNTPHASKLFHGVSTDTRLVKRGQLFVALKGERYDAHDFLNQAIDAGAAGLLVDRLYPKLTSISGALPVIAVESTYEALLTLAAYYRDAVGAKRIAITGSNGKTTTKEVTATLLQLFESSTYRSPGNLNNLIGAPLALFGMPTNTRLAVLEAGISIPGEMRKLSRLLSPNLVVITNVGLAHIERLGSREKIAEEKLQLALANGQKPLLLINGDDPILSQAVTHHSLAAKTFGLQKTNDLVAESISPTRDGGHHVTVRGVRFQMNLFGRHQIYNLLAGLAVCEALGYDITRLSGSQITFSTAPMRGEKRELHGATVIVDCYNANPDSVLSGLESFLEIPTDGRRFVVLGDMLELGDQGPDLHTQIGRVLAKSPIEQLLLVGPLSRFGHAAAIEAGRTRENARYAESIAEAIPLFHSLVHPGDVVYIKGSRGIGLEQLLNNSSPTEQAIH